MYSTHRPFQLLFVSCLLCLTVVPLVRIGMFMDGMLYNSVAHNLAHGFGTFWFPYFAKNTMAFFHEQPPLTFAIESLFYRALGDGIWVDRVYDSFTLGIAIFLIHKIWQTVVSDEYKAYSWLPLLLWLTVSCVNWGYANCMEENTMSMFVLLSVWLQARVIYKNAPIGYSFLAGVMLAGASLCKGFPGLFPLGMFGFAWLTGRLSFRKATMQTTAVMLALALCYTALYLYPESHKSLSAYLNDRVFNSIKNVSTQQGSRTWIASYVYNQHFRQLLVLAILVGIGYWRAKQWLLQLIPWRNALLFILLGLAGTIPLMVTLEQRGFYTATAVPYTAIGLAILALPTLHSWLQNATQKWKKYGTLAGGSLVLISAILVLTQIGKTPDNRARWHDYYILAEAVPPNAEVRIPAKMWNDWDLQCAMARLRFVSLNGNEDDALRYLIVEKNDTLPIPTLYSLRPLPTRYYMLYERK